ncbi:MAG: methyltransferase domain-containing protein [Nanoarchaeota archaeon]
MLEEFFIIKTKVRNALKGMFKSSDLILDVGCGENPYYHKGISSKVVCADIKPTKKAHFMGNAMSLPVKKEKFDGILSINALYYCSNPFKAIKEFAGILKKNGKLVLMTPFIYPIHDAPEDKYRFTKYGIIELLKDDFEIKSIKAIGGIFNLPAVFFHSLIKGIPLMFSKPIRLIIKLFSIIIFYPFYLSAQIISLLDFLDKSGRWPTYYFVVAARK